MRAVLLVALLAAGVVAAMAQPVAPLRGGVQTGVTTCPPGEGVTEFKTCAKCLPGFYKADSGLWGCNGCPAGAWSPPGATQCYNCPDGTASPTESPACDICDEGTYSQEKGNKKWDGDGSSYSYNLSPGYATCQPCPADFYQPAKQQASCMRCQNGWKSAAGAAMCTSGNIELKAGGKSTVTPTPTPTPTPAKSSSSSSSSSYSSGSSSYSGGGGSYGSEGYARLAQAGIKNYRGFMELKQQLAERVESEGPGGKGAPNGANMPPHKRKGRQVPAAPSKAGPKAPTRSRGGRGGKRNGSRK